jgi:hypothetical protein
MRYPLDIPGSTATVDLEAGGLFSGPKLFVNDTPARPGLKKGEFLIPSENGEELVVRFKQQFIDPIPALEVNGQLLRAVPAFTWEWIFVGLPFLLVVGGGCIGGLVGGIGAWGNATILRSSLPQGAKVALAALISAAVLGGGFTIITIARLALESARSR